jgi:hypothetical protein
MFENIETAKYVLQVFLNINSQMDQTIIAVDNKASTEEIRAFKLGVGYAMYEVFDKIIGPICKRHPSLKPPQMEG